MVRGRKEEKGLEEERNVRYVSLIYLRERVELQKGENRVRVDARKMESNCDQRATARAREREKDIADRYVKIGVY